MYKMLTYSSLLSLSGAMLRGQSMMGMIASPSGMDQNLSGAGQPNPGQQANGMGGNEQRPPSAEDQRRLLNFFKEAIRKHQIGLQLSDEEKALVDRLTIKPQILPLLEQSLEKATREEQQLKQQQMMMAQKAGLGAVAGMNARQMSFEGMSAMSPSHLPFGTPNALNPNSVTNTPATAPNVGTPGAGPHTRVGTPMASSNSNTNNNNSNTANLASGAGANSKTQSGSALHSTNTGMSASAGGSTSAATLKRSNTNNSTTEGKGDEDEGVGAGGKIKRKMSNARKTKRQKLGDFKEEGDKNTATSSTTGAGARPNTAEGKANGRNSSASYKRPGEIKTTASGRISRTGSASKVGASKKKSSAATTPKTEPVSGGGFPATGLSIVETPAPGESKVSGSSTAGLDMDSKSKPNKNMNANALRPVISEVDVCADPAELQKAGPDAKARYTASQVTLDLKPIHEV
ncbi:hypothetical protein SARC_15358 [Sphaeroforma arctica JP610]|uniref:Uncharacterized protein n=1 Tax=Sphaeroforma arctica JP610 TaxID=667725 RepID=A0A0L0F7J8_9EUKA|nr:hypothetical protein SARC_15358 [Sphaeroforma arctica JP610]KNC72093.1 hypothetical protein SARC_15358 [Sphaeroforma arctica JP610]|eukprot:XP_014145995.1 hypothetical protein SARC_15358 [Sphaeroforma arctica JP610]